MSRNQVVTFLRLLFFFVFWCAFAFARDLPCPRALYGSFEYWEQTYQNVRQRLNVVSDPLQVSFPENAKTVDAMLNQSKAVADYAGKVGEEALRLRAQKMIAELRKIRAAGFPYGRIFAATNEFLMLYTHYASLFFDEYRTYPYLAGVNFINDTENGYDTKALEIVVPRHLFFFTTRRLEMIDFLRVAHLPIHFIAVSMDLIATADSRLWSPTSFAGHDKFHAGVIIRTNEHRGYFHADLIERRKIWYPPFVDAIEAEPDLELREDLIHLVFDLFHECYFPLETVGSAKTFEASHLTSGGLFGNEIYAGLMSESEAIRRHGAAVKWIGRYFSQNPKHLKIIQSTLRKLGTDFIR